MDVSVKMTTAFVLIGIAGIAAGVLGMRLPTGDRIASGLALVVGAGVGIVSLALGTQVSDGSTESAENIFLVASALGFVATITGLALLWRWTSAGRG
jgi:hypothetical protein